MFTEPAVVGLADFLRVRMDAADRCASQARQCPGS
jgi:hypothetical protein